MYFVVSRFKSTQACMDLLAGQPSLLPFQRHLLDTMRVSRLWPRQRHKRAADCCEHSSRAIRRSVPPRRSEGKREGVEGEVYERGDAIAIVVINSTADRQQDSNNNFSTCGPIYIY